MRPPKSLPALSKQGFSIVEMVVVFAIVTVAISMFARTLASSKKLDPMATETTVAASAARTMIEKMKNNAFEDVFPLYNITPADDPGGAGTGPGAEFDVPGLTPIAPGAKCGSIIFPGNKATLSEDFDDAMMGLPRDLNADGVVDALDHSGDCILLPIRIRVEWIMHGSKGTHRSFEMYTMFGRF